MATLVEQAQNVPSRKRYTGHFSPEELDLCLAWLQGKVSRKQAMTVLTIKTSPSFYSWAARMSRELVVREVLMRKEEKE